MLARFLMGSAELPAERHDLVLHLCVAAAVVLIAGAGVAAGGTLCGTIVDADTGSPLAGAYATVEGTRLGAAADSAGSFCLPRVPAGRYRVVFQMIGYQPRVLRQVDVSPDDTTRVRARLSAQPVELAPVTVTGRTERELSQQLSTSSHTVRPAQVMSTAGAAEDLFRTIHTMPGVVARADFGTQFHVRGGTPDQNLVIVDGVPVFNPYRLKLLGGPVSMFNPDVVERVELLPGGFGAEYGDKLAAVLVVDNREGDREARHYRASVSLVDSRGLAEGPTPGTGGDGSWLLAGRRTYYDQLFNHLDDLPKGTVLPYFRDLQAKVVQDLGPRQQLIVNALDSREGTVLKDLDVEDSEDEGDDEFFTGADQFSLHTRIVGRLVGVTWNNAFSDLTLSRLALSHFDDDWMLRAEADERFFQASIAMRKLEMREDLFHVRSADHILQAGVGVTDFITDVTAAVRQDSAAYYGGNPADRRAEDGALVERRFRFQDASTASAIYVQDEIERWAPLVNLRVGLRFDHDTFSHRWQAGPRLGGTWRLAPTLAMRAGWGYYYQAPNFASLFERFEREIEWNLFETIRLEPEQAVHYLAGAEWRPDPGYTVKIESYHKQLDDLVVATDSTDNYIPNNRGEGFASGVEVFLHKRPSRQAWLAGWVSYSYGVTEERGPAERLHPRDFDQRHTANLVGSLRLGRGWSLESRFGYGSGFPWTPVARDAAGRARFDESGEVIWGPPNSRRLPAYQRLDLRFAWDSGDADSGRIHLQFYLEIINCLGRRNVYDYYWSDDYSKRGVSYMLPTLPFFGVHATW